MKKTILNRQHHKCANYPDSNLFKLWNFQCPIWDSKRYGHIKDGEYKITNIIDFERINDVNNQQALCWDCYYQRHKISKFTSLSHIDAALSEKSAGLFCENMNQNKLTGILLLLFPFLLMGKC